MINVPFLAADSIITDRPDATESSSVVDKGTVQLETGFLFADDSTEESLESFGSLVRIGFAEKWEARIAWSGYIDFDSKSFGGSDGIGDAAIGFKYFIQPEQGFQPMTALILHINTPIGDDAFSTDAFDPSFLVAFSHTLSETSSLGYNLGASLESSAQASVEKTTLASIDYSITYGFSVSESIGSYLEIFGSQGLSSPESPINIDGGFTYLLDDDTQFDLFAGVGINDEAPDWFIGIGFAKGCR